MNYSESFVQKAINFLKYLYKNGGVDYKEFDFISNKDYTLADSIDAKEFDKIILYLLEYNYISSKPKIKIASNINTYKDVRLTKLGIKEAEKSLPKMPMIGLVIQTISTGNNEIDIKINHARQMFLEEPQTMDKMRTACETLSYVLEPLRKECETIFSKKDINAFFDIVNNFDVRHNKEYTKKLEIPEQLECIFYSLLNTINTYAKIKSKNNDC
ncbi:MAG: hypothetical protein IPQ02_05370 [Saprospiraceae bacterium]|nr:hypothetical protein [Candidatus Defluviibacterium haderslevense]